MGNRERNPVMGLSNLLQTGEKYACRTRKSDLFYLLVAVEAEKPSVPVILENMGVMWVVEVNVDTYVVKGWIFFFFIAPCFFNSRNGNV